MKKVLITAVGALMLTVGGMTVANVDHTEAASNYSQKGNQHNHIASKAAVTSLPEYAVMAKKIDMTKYSAQIVQDNLNKRIIVLKDQNGQEQYKSIFVKKQNRLKVVDYSGGLILNQLVGQDVQSKNPSTPPNSNETVHTPEYKKLSTTVNLTGYSEKVVEDNNGKRITLFKDAKGHAQYKTIFVKKTGLVKVIKLSHN